MRKLKLSDNDESQQDDEYSRQQKQIDNLIEKYKEKKRKIVLNELQQAFFQYNLYLQQNYASPAKWTWLKQRRVQVNKLKNQKATQNQQENFKNFVTKGHIEVLEDQNKKAIDQIDKDLQQAIQISTYIRAQLDKQIQDLDRVYEKNKDINVRIRRSMDGLRTMLRRIMMSKLTRFLSIVTVLAIIVLIVIYVLKNNGTIV